MIDNAGTYKSFIIKLGSNRTPELSGAQEPSQRQALHERPARMRVRSNDLLGGG